MKIPKRDPEEDEFVDMLLRANSLEKAGYLAAKYSLFDSKRMKGRYQNEPTWPLSKYDKLGSRRKLLSEFISKRQKEKEELRELKKQKRELKKIKREKKELKKIKKEKKELRKMAREKKELKRKERAETTLNDGDEAPSKKLKLVEAVRDDNPNEKEMVNLEAVSSEDVDQQRQCVPLCEPVGNLMAEGLKKCTREAEKKNENVDQSKDE